MKGFKNTTRTFSGHSFAQGGPVGGVTDFHSNTHGSALVRREVPSNEMQREGGGRGPLTPGYAHGGKAKHFHVHKHYHSGGKVTSKSKSYRGAEHSAEREVEGAGSMMASGGHIHDDTSIPPGSPDYAKGGKTGKKWIQGAIKHPGALHKALHVPEGKKIPSKKLTEAKHSQNPTMRRRAALAQTLGRMHKATGGTINKMNAGGALYGTGGTINPRATGGTINALAPGGQPAMPSRIAAPSMGALGQLAAAGRGAPLRRPRGMPGRMAPGPLGRAKGGRV